MINRAFLKAFILGLLIPGTLFLSNSSANERIEIKSDGVTLTANLVMAEEKTLKDGVILLTHGTLAHNKMEIIKTLQELLAEREINTLAINLGLGLSNREGQYDCAVPHRHRHQDGVTEIELWTNWLASKGASHIAVMGHSRGGNQTAWFATETKQKISKVILIAPMLSDPAKEATGYETRYGAALAPLLARAEKLVAAGKGDTLMEKISFIYCQDTSVSAASFVSYYKPETRRHTPNLLSKINVPVLVFAGSEDKVVEGLAEAVAPLADGKKVSLQIIEDATHYFLDFAAEDLADGIAEFLEN